MTVPGFGFLRRLLLCFLSRLLQLGQLVLGQWWASLLLSLLDPHCPRARHRLPRALFRPRASPAHSAPYATTVPSASALAERSLCAGGTSGATDGALATTGTERGQIIGQEKMLGESAEGRGGSAGEGGGGRRRAADGGGGHRRPLGRTILGLNWFWTRFGHLRPYPLALCSSGSSGSAPPPPHWFWLFNPVASSVPLLVIATRWVLPSATSLT